jgi:steroid 5-alpha reductase family enzyme
MLSVYFSILALIFCYATIWFIISLILKRNDIADIAWGGGFALVTLSTLFMFAWHPTQILLSILIFIWSARLITHITVRNAGKKEDFRYKAWRDSWGKLFYIRSYLQVYLLQGFLLSIIAIPILVTAQNPRDLSIVSMLGLLIWSIGFLFEAVGDYQLLEFIRSKPKKNEILTSGLWQYTRHPNYFGEVAMWWGIYLIAFNAQYGLVMLLSPLTITYLILYVSGIPMLERKWDKNKKYQEYKKRTNAFFPWFPKSYK